MSVTQKTRCWNPNCTKITFGYVGATIETFSRDERIMSDVWAYVTYARVWDAETGSPKTIRLQTEGWEASATAVVDATPEVLAAYEAWKVEQEAKRAAEEAARQAALAAWEAKQPRRGRIIKVVKGRKVPKGTVGVCIWIGDGYYGQRVGLKTDDGEVYWTAASNVEAVAA